MIMSPTSSLSAAGPATTVAQLKNFSFSSRGRGLTFWCCRFPGSITYCLYGYLATVHYTCTKMILNTTHQGVQMYTSTFSAYVILIGGNVLTGIMAISKITHTSSMEEKSQEFSLQTHLYHLNSTRVLAYCLRGLPPTQGNTCLSEALKQV